jgi:ribosome-binding protein aMBF1 (putative translation factor)
MRLGACRRAPQGTMPHDRSISKTANLAEMADSVSPIGTSVSDAIKHNRARSKRYREEYDRLEPFEQIARIVIMRRGQLGLSQQELAVRMGTTASVISRIESGQHRTSTDTLRRLANALDGQAMFGFEFEPGETELIAL